MKLLLTYVSQVLMMPYVELFELVLSFLAMTVLLILLVSPNLTLYGFFPVIVISNLYFAGGRRSKDLKDF